MILLKLKQTMGVLVVSSRVIANELNKRHDHVIRDIENILKSQSPCLGDEIIQSEYVSDRGRKYKEYLLTKNGFTLYMFNIQEYNDFKMAYINRFNEMERALLSQTIPSYQITDPIERAKRWIEEETTRQ